MIALGYVCQEVVRDLRHLGAELLGHCGLLIPEQAVAFVLDVLAVAEDEERAEDGPLNGVPEVLEGAAGGLPGGPLPPGEREREDDAQEDEDVLDDANPQGKRLVRGSIGVMKFLIVHT